MTKQPLFATLRIDSLLSRLILFTEDEVAEKSKVTRITAKDDAPKAKSVAKAAVTKGTETKAVKTKRAKQPRAEKESTNYFKGAWQELKQVRWPTRKATWGLTLAVIIFSLFFVAVILLLDGGFNYLFELIIG